MIEVAIGILISSLACLHAVNCYKEHILFLNENSKKF